MASEGSVDFESESPSKDKINDIRNDDEFNIDNNNNRRPMLKPSENQIKKEQYKNRRNSLVRKSIEKEVSLSQKHTVKVQSDILSQYLGPTNIMSKYQTNENIYGRSMDMINREDSDSEAFNEVEFDLATNTLNDKMIKDADQILNEQDVRNEKPMTFDDIYEHLTSNAELFKDMSINIYDFRHLNCVSQIWLKMFKPQLSVQLSKERNEIFYICKLKLDYSDDFHEKLLQSIWMYVTKENRFVSKIGNHWEQIGFQGSDPSTDIRGSGLYGLLQLLHIAHEYPILIHKIYTLSIHDRYNFPLSIVSFKITNIVINLLRSTLIYSHINSYKSVNKALNEIHASLFLQFYLYWKRNLKTIEDFDAAEKKLNNLAFNQWKVSIKQLQQWCDELSGNDDTKLDENITFGLTNTNTSIKTKECQSRLNAYQLQSKQ